MRKPLMCISLLLLTAYSAVAQDTAGVSIPYNISYEYRICKLPVPVMLTVYNKPGHTKVPPVPAVIVKKPLLTASGELGYQYFNREAASDNLLLINTSSHIATLRLNLVYRETYPFTTSVRYNRASPFQMDDQYEVNFGFDERGFRQLVRDRITGSMKSQSKQKQSALLTKYEQTFRQLQQQKQLLENPAYLQQVVEKRLPASSLPSLPNLPNVNPEEMLAQQLPVIDRANRIRQLPRPEQVTQRIRDSIESKVSRVAIPENSLRNRWDSMHNKLEQKRDSLQGRLKNLSDSLADTKQQLGQQLDSLNNEMGEIASASALKKYADKKGIKDSLAGNKWATLLMKTNFRLGKFLVNHSELTVNNIFLHGISIQYGHEKFATVSAGYYDFAFRQLFSFRNDTTRGARPFVLAAKLGKTDGKNLEAINLYIGRKTKPGSVNNELATVAGISLERKFAFHKNLSLDLELAKSTTLSNSVADKAPSTLKDLFTSFNTRTMGAFGALKAYVPATKTDAEISYRYWGQQFQSFNAGQYFNPQNNLAAKLNQPLFNRKLYLTTGIRYTDFRSFGIASNIKTKTLFASANATLRLKKLPIVSVGYYPGSQLYWLDHSKLYEYFYYILNTTASHYFTIGKMPVQAVFTYNKFFNRYTDSVVNGAQSYYNLFLTAWKNRFSYTLNGSRQGIENNTLWTVETGMGYQAEKLRISSSLKWNFIGAQTRMGYTATAGLFLGRTGTINLIYDRSWLPDRNAAFIPVSTGQVQIIKPLKFSVWQ